MLKEQIPYADFFGTLSKSLSFPTVGESQELPDLAQSSIAGSSYLSHGRGGYSLQALLDHPKFASFLDAQRGSLDVGQPIEKSSLWKHRLFSIPISGNLDLASISQASFSGRLLSLQFRCSISDRILEDLGQCLGELSSLATGINYHTHKLSDAHDQTIFLVHAGGNFVDLVESAWEIDPNTYQNYPPLFSINYKKSSQTVICWRWFGQSLNILDIFAARICSAVDE